MALAGSNLPNGTWLETWGSSWGGLHMVSSFDLQSLHVSSCGAGEKGLLHFGSHTRKVNHLKTLFARI